MNVYSTTKVAVFGTRSMMRIALCIVLLSLPLRSLSEESLDSVRRRFTIEEIEVTAIRSHQPVVPPQSLSGERLQQLSVQSVADALRYFSGVQIKDYGGVAGLKTVDLRSMGSHHLGVFYDGIEIGNAQNGTVDLGKFAMENMEEVSLYNGQRSDMLQSARDYGSAGTLYLQTRRPRFTGNKSYNLSVSMKAGTFGLANPSILYEQKLTDNLHLSANAAYTFATGRYHFRLQQYKRDGTLAWDTTGVRQNGDIQAIRGEVGLFGYTTTGKWHLKGYYYQACRGIPHAIIRNVWTSDERQWDRNTFVQGSWENRWERVALRIAAKYSNDYMRYLNPDTTRLYIDNHFLQQEAYVTASLQYDIFDWWTMSLAGDYKYNTLNADLVNFVYPVRHTGLTALATRLHYKWLTLQASALGTFVRDFTTPPSGTKAASFAYNRVTPAVYLNYQPVLGERLYIFAFYKNVFRMPTFNDLYYTDVGNIHLRPEFATQYDLGAEWTHAFALEQSGVSASNGQQAMDVHLKADGYFNQVHDKIIAIPKGNNQYRWQMMNLGYVEILGVDVNAGLTFHLPHKMMLALQGTYTYQHAVDLSTPGANTYGGQIAYVPWHSTSATANLSWSGWAINYAFIYVGERYHNSANIPANYERPWYTHDLAITKQFDFHTWRFTASVEINNLLNQQYEVILNYPMPGINGNMTLKFEL